MKRFSVGRHRRRDSSSSIRPRPVGDCVFVGRLVAEVLPRDEGVSINLMFHIDVLLSAFFADLDFMTRVVHRVVEPVYYFPGIRVSNLLQTDRLTYTVEAGDNQSHCTASSTLGLTWSSTLC